MAKMAVKKKRVSRRLVKKKKTENGIKYDVKPKDELDVDLFNRKILISPSDEPSTSYTYDNACPCGGKVHTEAIPNYGTITYNYDIDGNLTKTIYPDGTEIDNEYDNNDNLTDVFLNNNLITYYDYNEVNKPYRVTDIITGATKVYNISNYDAAGHKLEIDYPNNNSMQYTYGTAYRLSKADGYMNMNQNMLTKNEITAWDNAGNITAKNTMLGNISYGYDNVYRLTNYTNPVADQNKIAYAYDPAGNRNTVTINGSQVTSYTNNDLNQITYVGSINYINDYNGNLVLKGSYAGYEYDFDNRLTTVLLTGKTINYKYNHDSLKLEKDIYGAVASRYYYNGTKLLAEGDGTKIIKIYTNDDEGVLGMTRKIYGQSNNYHYQSLYYLFDNLGSVVAITDDSGKPVQYYQYDPYGQITNTTNDPINSITFIGRYYGQMDWDTGFIYFWHRWYDSQNGRWISRDPAGVLGGINLYEYTIDNPINHIDEIGLCPPEGTPTMIFPPPVPIPTATPAPPPGPLSCEAQFTICAGKALLKFAGFEIGSEGLIALAKQLGIKAVPIIAKRVMPPLVAADAYKLGFDLGQCGEQYIKCY